MGRVSGAYKSGITEIKSKMLRITEIELIGTEGVKVPEKLWNIMNTIIGTTTSIA